MARYYFRAVRQITDKADEYFDISPGESYELPAEELALLPHPEWISEQILTFSKTFNGVLFTWKSRPESVGRPCQGKLHLQPLQDIYGDWQGIVYFDGHLAPAEPRLRHFKVLDFFADEAGVGFYHDEAQDRALHLYVFQEYGPLPLGVDFDGYLRLLSQSLAHSHWPYLLAELAAHVATEPDQPFAGPHTPNARIFVEDMTSQTDFSLAEFVALYHQVRLPG